MRSGASCRFSRSSLALTGKGEIFLSCGSTPCASALQGSCAKRKTLAADVLARDPDELRTDEPAIADTEGLCRRFLEDKTLPWFENRRKELANRPLIREQNLRRRTMDNVQANNLARWAKTESAALSETWPDGEPSENNVLESWKVNRPQMMAALTPRGADKALAHVLVAGVPEGGDAADGRPGAGGDGVTLQEPEDDHSDPILDQIIT